MSIRIKADCNLLLTVDDITIILMFSHKDLNVISPRLGKEWEFCSDWLVDNKLSLHFQNNMLHFQTETKN